MKLYNNKAQSYNIDERTNSSNCNSDCCSLTSSNLYVSNDNIDLLNFIIKNFFICKKFDSKSKQLLQEYIKNNIHESEYTHTLNLINKIFMDIK